MKILKFYEYPMCSTCKKALKFLANHRYPVAERINIFETPPTREELKKMLAFKHGYIRSLFNTAGKVYQEMGIKDKIAKLTPDQALDMLAKDGRLVKRPFVLMEDKGLVGFDVAEWREVFKD